MTRVLVPLAEGFEEIETSTVGPSTAMAFALHLVQRLQGPEARETVARALLCDRE